MNVVHLGESDTGGGAANAMAGLHEALRRVGVDSHLLVHRGEGERAGRHTIATRGDGDPLFLELYHALVRHYVELNRTEPTNTHFSLYVDGVDASHHPVVASSTLVHLHWTASFQTPADVGALLDAKPLVWTLHDLGPLSGGCHFPAGCRNYAVSCAACPQLVRDPFGITATTLRDKAAQWRGGRLTFIAPSRHMAALAGRSALVHELGAAVVHIPHGVDVEAFRPSSKAAARRALGLPVDGLYVLCGSHHNAERRKNLSVVHRVLDAVCSQRHADAAALTLLTVGEPKLDALDDRPYGLVQLGHVPLATMPSVYAAADVFLHPSVEDNFPCMLLESSSCGTPAIAFDVGGIGEIVLDGVSGHTVPALDDAAMAAALSALLDDPDRLRRMSHDTRARAVEQFGDLASARRHVELYDELAARAPVASRPRPMTTALDEVFPRWSAACLVAELNETRERAAARAVESEAKSEYIAALEQQLCTKDAELAAVHRIAEERRRLSTDLHDAAERVRTIAENLQREVAERDESLRQLVEQLRDKEAEVGAVHRIAEERGRLLTDLHEEAERTRAIAEGLQRDVNERDERLRQLGRRLREREAEIEALYRIAADFQREIRERDDALAQLRTTVEDQRGEIELVHRIARERLVLIDQLAAHPR